MIAANLQNGARINPFLWGGRWVPISPRAPLSLNSASPVTAVASVSSPVTSVATGAAVVNADGSVSVDPNATGFVPDATATWSAAGIANQFLQAFKDHWFALALVLALIVVLKYGHKLPHHLPFVKRGR
jgi:hypothetical protein